jgi:ABC-type lipoprotein export system ATPase subunit
MNAVELRDVFRVFSTPEGAAAALQGLTLNMREHEVVVVLGPSGSGKTTLLRLLAGLDRPSAGSVRVLGSEIGKLSARRLAAYRKRTVGYVEQHYTRSLAPELSAREAVAFQLGLAGASQQARFARADELLERIGFTDLRDAHPDALSGGEQQRVAVCAALAHRPRLLLADEPTGELDAASASDVYAIIGELAREQGCTTMIVSHDPESATIADRVVSVRDGRVSEESGRDVAGEDSIVVGRGGWLRVPEELLLRARIRSHARARFSEPGVLLLPAESGHAEADQAEPASTAAAAEPLQTVVAEVRSLAKTFESGRRTTKVFSRLDASFARGRLIAVTGPSGSGKTTLLHLLAGLERPTSGDAVVLGRSLSALDRAALAALRREHVALVRQEPGLVTFLSARENVELALAVRRRGTAEVSRQALDALERVGLGERSGQRVSRLSAGEQERVAIARALAADPELLLVDEPTSRLDQANALAIAALFWRTTRETGTTIVCATHDPLLIEQADEDLSLGGR